MPKSWGYKNAYDRVIVIHPEAFGKHGTVVNQNEQGRVTVKLDDGTVFCGWEGAEVIYEDEPLPEQPVSVNDLFKQQSSTALEH